MFEGATPKRKDLVEAGLARNDRCKQQKEVGQKCTVPEVAKHKCRNRHEAEGAEHMHTEKQEAGYERKEATDVSCERKMEQEAIHQCKWAGYSEYKCAESEEAGYTKTEKAHCFHWGTTAQEHTEQVVDGVECRSIVA